MLFSVLSIFQASESTDLPMRRTLQHLSMVRLFDIDNEDAYTAFERRVLAQESPNDACRWAHVECSGTGEVVRITQDKCAFKYKRLKIGWLPKTLESITIVHLEINEGLETRTLPPNLTYFHFDDCALRGSVELWTLPSTLMYFLVPNNCFEGVLLVDNLPKGIRKIHLSNNWIDSVLVINTGIPDSLLELHVTYIRRPVKITTLHRREKSNRCVHSDAYPRYFCGE